MSFDGSVVLVALGAGFVTVVAVMAFGLFQARRTHMLTGVDTPWGIGFIAVALVSAILALRGDGDRVLPWILFALTALWGGRLAWHLHQRNHGKDEDPRYAELAEQDNRATWANGRPSAGSPPGTFTDLVARRQRGRGAAAGG